jgi:hypothetical protein
MNLFAPVTTTLKGSDRLALLSWRPLALRGVARLPDAMRRTPARRQLVVALFLGAILAAIELISRAGLSILEQRGVEYQPPTASTRRSCAISGRAGRHTRGSWSSASCQRISSAT